MARKPANPSRAPVDREPTPTPAPPLCDEERQVFLPMPHTPSATDIREVEIAAAITIAVLSLPRIVEECLKSKTEHNHDLARGVAEQARRNQKDEDPLAARWRADAAALRSALDEAAAYRDHLRRISR